MIHRDEEKKKKRKITFDKLFETFSQGKETFSYRKEIFFWNVFQECCIKLLHRRNRQTRARYDSELAEAPTAKARALS